MRCVHGGCRWWCDHSPSPTRTIRGGGGSPRGASSDRDDSPTRRDLRRIHDGDACVDPSRLHPPLRRTPPGCAMTGKTSARLIYAVLALLVAGPLLAPGLVLAVDLNVVPHPHLPASIWGLPTGTHGGPPNRLPFDLLFV